MEHPDGVVGDVTSPVRQDCGVLSWHNLNRPTQLKRQRAARTRDHGVHMPSSKRIAGLVGPTIVAMYQRGAAKTGSAVFMVLEGALLACGLVMTFKAYSPDRA